MSGLAGMILGTKERAPVEYERVAETFQRLLAMSDVRGADAAGIATVCRCGLHSLVKRAVRATHLLSHPHYQHVLRPILGRIGPRTTAILGHARRGTVREPSRRRNFQPIRACHVIGTHDGRISNADELFERWGLPRYSESDAEVLFRIADEHVEDGAFQLDRLRPLLQEFRGSLSAVMTSRVAAGEILFLKGNRPLELCFHPERAVVMYASDGRFLDAAITEDSGWQPIELPEMHLAVFRVRDIANPRIELFAFDAVDTDEAEPVPADEAPVSETEAELPRESADEDDDDDDDDDDE